MSFGKIQNAELNLDVEGQGCRDDCESEYMAWTYKGSTWLNKKKCREMVYGTNPEACPWW